MSFLGCPLPAIDEDFTNSFAHSMSRSQKDFYSVFPVSIDAILFSNFFQKEIVMPINYFLKSC